MFQNQQGLTMTAAHQDAVDAFDRMVDLFFEYSPDTGAALTHALEIDSGLIMGHCLNGYFMQLMGNASVLGQADEALAKADALAAGATDRQELLGSHPYRPSARFDRVEAGPIRALVSWRSAEHARLHRPRHAGLGRERAELQQRSRHARLWLRRKRRLSGR